MNHPLVICAIFKNEGLYIKEWIEFHRIVGVSKFYLYDNGSTDNCKQLLEPYINEGIVILKDWPYPNPSQLAAYSDFIHLMNNAPIWAAFIDIDEFLFSPVCDNLCDLLAKCQEPQAIGVNWVCFGSGGEEDYKEGLVTERFHLRSHDWIKENRHIKSIIRLDQDVRCGGDPHFFQVQHGTFMEDGTQINSAGTPHHACAKIRLNHYKTKSKNEWYARALGGKPDRFQYKIDWRHFDMVNGTEVDDTVIWKFLPELKRRMQSPQNQ